MKPVIQIFSPLDEGKHIVILQGRDLNDLTVNDGKLIVLKEVVRSEAIKRGLIMMEYSKSSGLIYDLSALNKNEADEVLKVLSNYGIANNLNKPSCGNNEDEFTLIMRGILKLVTSDKYPSFRDGRQMAFMVIINFCEHLCPSLQPGTHSEVQVIGIELAIRLSKSLGLRKSGCYVLLNEERQGAIDPVLNKSIPILRLEQPDEIEKRAVIDALHKRYTKAKLTSDLTDEVIIVASKNTPNRGLEQLFLASERSGKIIESKNIFKKKQEDIIALSEGTLEAVDFEKVKGLDFVGRNILKPFQILVRLTDALKKGDKSVFRNLILAGAPSTGKTMLATYAAYKAGIQTFILNSPKSGIVGESERKCKLMLQLMKEQGGVGLIDELELVMPMNRGSQSLDSGVSQNLMGQFQSFLADPSLSGRVSLIGTSNKPQNLSEAMISRWLIIPVLIPLKEDYPAILQSLSKSIDPNIVIDINNSDFKAAAERFYFADASPREIRESLIGAMSIIAERFGLQHIIYASYDIIPSSSRESYIHSDLMAIKCCRNNSFMPWWDIPNNKPDPTYPYPDYISEIMDNDHFIDRQKLNAKINQLEPYANV